MEHALDAGGRGGHRGAIGDIALDHRKLRISVVLLEVSAAADDKAVERADAAALRQQLVDEMAADEARPARHQIDSRRCHHPSSRRRDLCGQKSPISSFAASSG